MEHEVFVPVPVPSLRRTLGDLARVARCVPGLQQDADASAGPLSGRLKVRVDGHTITYRGALRLTVSPQDGADGDDGILVAGEGVEARGTGSAKLALTISLTQKDGGTAIGFAGTASGDGRLLELDPAAALATAHRLLDRFVQQLVTETLAGEDAAGEDIGEAERSVGKAVEQAIEEAAEEADATGAATTRSTAPEAADDTGDTDTGDTDTGDTDDTDTDDGATADEAPSTENPPGTGSVFDAPVPPPSLDPVAEVEFTVPDGPPAEAAHARRTMIGRSAEEVDHAPPRGRYAPVPSPDSTTAGATLRWVAPAAALALASAVVVSRALRRRR
ncbi:carbon monoxide dehydrogenase [Streptomyces atratus]|uniref:carbon monoxide dehydrogenase n=1 Tax=Streptomyces atratus TaxID=1893 RepID=UPI0022521DD9|nr:carbon monoxide dehydrogenase [Streptomyces atratus]MCX5342555.1 carbon monoxide dehydrogenase [Streptomyces atratus]